MSTQPEGALTSRIMQAIRATYGARCWITKIHGSIHQHAGIPDIVGVLDGAFIALEVKRPGGGYGVTRIQRVVMDRLASAGAHVAVVTSPTEALEALARWGLAPAGE